ncbi:MAG: type II toxin-antitoxin system VapC family toxin [Planctomycetes bacterium]|nr:type II toxin-antitoxin system VapC family toxin [Planctomycetota bacterium]
MIFVDTWAWVALALKRDQHHLRAKAQHKKLRRAGRRYVTTNFVLSEVIAHLYTTLTADQARTFVDNILTSADAGTYQLVHVSPDQFRRAWQLRQKYHDKPDISFVDFTSMVVMQDLGLSAFGRKGDCPPEKKGTVPFSSAATPISSRWDWPFSSCLRAVHTCVAH